MSTMIENRWDPRLQNQNGPITSGFVSNSDIRQRERADQIKWERQREYEDMMSKNIKVKYMDTNGLSLPVGGYEESRKVYDDQRQQECIEFMAQKKDQEDRRREELYLNSQRNYKPPPEPEMYDHHQISKELREERQKEYNDYLREKENHMMSSRRPPPTPPGGLNIATEQERKKLENLKKSMYRDELLKQKNQQLFHRAQQEGTLPNLNSSSPPHGAPNRMSPHGSPRGRPPPHPNSRIPPPDDRMAPGSMPQDQPRPSDEIRTGFFDDRRRSPPNRDERQHEYQEFLAKKQHDDDVRRQRLDEQRHAPRSDISKGDYYDADSYERKKQTLNSQRREEYQDFLSKKTPDHGRREWHDTSNPKGIIAGIDSYNYDKKKTFAEERRKEYKEVMEKKSEQFKKQQEDREHFKAMLDRQLMESPPIIPIGEYDTKKRQYKQEAHQEMIHFLESQPPGNRDKEFWNKVTKPRIFPQSGEYKNRKEKLNDELKKDWRDHVLKQPPMKERNKEFGTPGAVLFTGEYEKTRRKVREERTKDFHDYLQKYGSQPVKRLPDQNGSNNIGFVASMGRHEQERSRLGKQRQDEYKKFLDEDSWYRQEPPPFHHNAGQDRAPEHRPESYGRRQTPSYQDMLDAKRREEASYRRFDDPEYSRGGAPPGGPYDRYD